METDHTERNYAQLIPDYVLGLLPVEDQQHVERHARHCAACREALRRERRLEALVQGTVNRVVEAGSSPNCRPATAARLRALRPVPPARGDVARRRLYRHLAPVTLVMALLALALFIQSGRPESIAPAFAQTRWASTVRPPTATDSHPATATTPSTSIAATPESTLAAVETSAATLIQPVATRGAPRYPTRASQPAASTPIVAADR